MSHADVTCAHCGATIARQDARFCEYCGTERPRPAPTAPPTRSVGPHGDLSARFAALRAAPGLEAALARQPSTTMLAAGQWFGAVFLLVFTVIAFVMTAAFAQMMGLMAVVPAGMALLGLFLFGRQVRRSAGFSTGELVSSLVLVAGERTDVRGGHEHARTTYYVTLEDETGRREEYATTGKVAGSASRGDLGVAWIRGDMCVGFERVPV